MVESQWAIKARLFLSHNCVDADVDVYVDVRINSSCFIQLKG